MTAIGIVIDPVMVGDINNNGRGTQDLASLINQLLQVGRGLVRSVVFVEGVGQATVLVKTSGHVPMLAYEVGCVSIIMLLYHVCVDTGHSRIVQDVCTVPITRTIHKREATR